MRASGQIWDLEGMHKEGKSEAWRADLRRWGTYGRTDGLKDGHQEIPLCVLQDIVPLRPLPKKRRAERNRERIQERKEGRKKKHRTTEGRKTDLPT